MLKKMLGALRGKNDLVKAARNGDRKRFAEVFGPADVLFLQLPPGMEEGLDPGISQDELLEKVRAAAQDLGGREEFTPYCIVRNGQSRTLLFTSQELAQKFTEMRFRETQRIMPFQVLTVAGEALAGLFASGQTAVFNIGSESQFEVSAEDARLIAERWAK